MISPILSATAPTATLNLVVNGVAPTRQDLLDENPPYDKWYRITNDELVNNEITWVYYVNDGIESFIKYTIYTNNNPNYDPEKPLQKDRTPKVDDAVTNIKSYMNTSYGCTFFPWVLIKDNINNNQVWVPPSVVALGTFSSSQKRTELWFAPAGFNRGGLRDGAAGLPVLQTALKLSAKDRDTLYEANINPIATFPAEGIVIFGQKTLQVTPSALDRINVRRLMIYLKKEISRMATAVLFDPNTEVTWNRFLDMVTPFLASVQSRFGLSDYRVVLDNTTTTPDLVDRNVMYAKIMLKPTRAIEFIALDFVISNTGASFAD